MTKNDQTGILVVDDEEKVRLLLRRCFEDEGYFVKEAKDRREVNEHLNSEIGLVTLDLKMVNDNGLDIARDIQSRYDVPIIIISGKNDPVDRVVGLEIGADDFISKPFHVGEMLARVRAVLRRHKPQQTQHTVNSDAYPKTIRFENWIVDFSSFAFQSTDGKQFHLSASQMKLLEVFIDNPGKVLTRAQILNKMRGQDWVMNDRNIDNHVSRLRKIIEKNPKSPRCIKTVHGEGYIFSPKILEN